jgi:hypothetical protein
MFPFSLIRWLGKASRSSAVTARPTFRPWAETLEAREVAAFLASITYPTSATAWDVQTADVNNDGKLDVLSVSRSAGTLSVALGDGDGTLGEPRSFAAGPTPRALAVADINSDGKLDVVTVNEGSNLSLLKGNGDGTFQSRTNIGISGGKGTKAAAVEVGDMNRDGKLDLVVGAVSNTYKLSGILRQDGQIFVLTGRGDGSFRSTSSVSIVGSPVRSYLMVNPGISPVNIALGDVNGDGNLDVVAATYRETAVIVGAPGDRPVYVLPGDGNGRISLTERTIALVNGPAALSLDDFNADGRLDLAVTNNPSGGGVQVSLGNGDGTFQYSGYGNVDDGTWLFDMAAIDVNQDGKLDLVAVHRGDGNGGISVSLGNGDGTFQARQTFGWLSGYTALAIGDFDGDGYPDLVALDGSSLSLFLNDRIW